MIKISSQKVAAYFLVNTGMMEQKHKETEPVNLSNQKFEGKANALGSQPISKGPINKSPINKGPINKGPINKGPINKDMIKRDPIRIGQITLTNAALLAPMSGVTDKPFRRIAHRLGAGLVVTEMLASKQLVAEHPDALLKAENDGIYPFVIQLAGREALWMGEGARRAEALGADIIDINMGCPAKQVTRGLAGSALMRDLDHALTLIEAVVQNVSVPVTLKMRLGWDDSSINAPELARRAVNAGVQMITVHGRTRCQFYTGSANWTLIADVKKAVSVPVIANGDATSLQAVKAMLEASGADGVMIGRGAYGAPWFPGQAGHYTATGEDRSEPNLQEQRNIILEHYEGLISHYGVELGIRNARKHLGWYLERVCQNSERLALWRSRLFRESDPQKVLHLITEFYEEQEEEAVISNDRKEVAA